MQNMFGTVILVIAILAVAFLAVGIIDGNRFVTVREEFAGRTGGDSGDRSAYGNELV